MPKQGAVVLSPFPFTDLNGSKVRPALVLSNTKRGNDAVVAFITTKQKAKKFIVSVVPTEQNGLKKNSQIICNKLATLDKKVFIGEIGTLSSSDLQKVKSSLKELFAL